MNPVQGQSTKRLIRTPPTAKVRKDNSTRRSCHTREMSKQTKCHATSLDGILGQKKEIRGKLMTSGSNMNSS